MSIRRALLLLAPTGLPTQANAKDTPHFLFETAETEWKSERIVLPPGFAPGMTWVGEEHIRFAPGFFEPEAGDFFSYVLVFLVQKDAVLSEQHIEKELLLYFQGLSSVVMANRDLEVDTTAFKIDLGPVEDAKTGRTNGVRHQGSIDWTEPFKTQAPQSLQLEVDVWKEGGRQVLFLCVSPAGATNPVWGRLRAVREGFRLTDG